MNTETKPRMTVAEIALMREIVRWRRANGIVWNVNAGGWTEPWDQAAETYPEWRNRRRTVSADLSGGAVGISSGRASFDWIKTETVTQAVDLLAALGYLPKRFSSAYAEGWRTRGVADAGVYHPTYADAVRPAGGA